MASHPPESPEPSPLDSLWVRTAAPAVPSALVGYPDGPDLTGPEATRPTLPPPPAPRPAAAVATVAARVVAPAPPVPSAAPAPPATASPWVPGTAPANGQTRPAPPATASPWVPGTAPVNGQTRPAPPATASPWVPGTAPANGHAAPAPPTTAAPRVPATALAGDVLTVAPSTRPAPRRAVPVEPPPRPRGRWLLEWVMVLLVAVGVAFGVRTFVVQTFFIPSASMEPTLMIGDRILVDKLSYHLHAVHRGDIVVFATPPNENAGPNVKDLVKRVIGLPGDRISSQGGRVWIDGKPLSEPWLPPGTITTGIEPQTVPPGKLFVMGDNRSNSQDSRFFGPIPRSLIVGRVVIRIWPLSALHIF